MRLDHPIFNEPLDPRVVLDEDEVWEPEHDPRGTWLVHTGEFGEGVDVGMVSDGHGFEDSPDCERISGGVNSKGPYALAIGRQANLLHWGFYGAPDRMTDSAKEVFLNAIVYMTRFDGHRPLVKKVSTGRSWVKQTIESVAALPEVPDERRARMEEYLREALPEDAVGECGLDAEALMAWYDDHVEYLHSEARYRGHAVDPVLEELGLSNREPAFLDFLVERLEADPDDAVARELAARYVSADLAGDPQRLLGWIAEHQDRLFFSDVGGYRWLADTNPRPRTALEAASSARRR